MSHSERAEKFVADSDRTTWHDNALWFVRQKRDRSIRSVPEWETLRGLAAAIKSHTIATLDQYLVEFETKATEHGAVVHWAETAEEHNQIVLKLLREANVSRVVKSKSMLTEECDLNHFLSDHGFSVVDTDLGERIVQLKGEPPSHIVLPAIHLKKEDVSNVFQQHLNTEPGNCDPKYLTEAARIHLRQEFLQADAGITGVNFAVAESGGIVICTNEGNADLGISLPKLHIASMGIEKVIPRVQDLSVFLRILARSATGQPITTYSSHIHGPIAGGQLHIILVDKGRSEIRKQESFRQALNCIRCGACMNTCPVYRRSGGHSYGATVPGPIGSILNPLDQPQQHSSLPYACTLCGSCTDVCPAKIDLHHQLFLLRGQMVELGTIPRKKVFGMKLTRLIMNNSAVFSVLGRGTRIALKYLPRALIYNKLNVWGRQRELPTVPQESFREYWKKQQSKRDSSSEQ